MGDISGDDYPIRQLGVPGNLNLFRLCDAHLHGIRQIPQPSADQYYAQQWNIGAYQRTPPLCNAAALFITALISAVPLFSYKWSLRGEVSPPSNSTTAVVDVSQTHVFRLQKGGLVSPFPCVLWRLK